ncbi:MAG TPA: hypothetical protein DCP64_04290 [Sarcina sp.]|nr:hypothetical protein [Sarcina sp.]
MRILSIITSRKKPGCRNGCRAFSRPNPGWCDQKHRYRPPPFSLQADLYCDETPGLTSTRTLAGLPAVLRYDMMVTLQFGRPAREWMDMNMDLQTEKRTGWIPWVNILLIAVNVIVFVAGTAGGAFGLDAGFLHRRGGLFAPLILKRRELYRLVTAVFLHADARHLMNNMVVQFAGGSIVERNLGHLRFAAVYFLSGIIGNLTSVAADYVTGEYSYSVGASGAVFGIVGVLLFLIIREARQSNKGEQGIPPRLKSLLIRAGIMTAYLLYSGWSNPMINQAAHVGGLAAGFVFGALLLPDGEGDISELMG